MMRTKIFPIDPYHLLQAQTKNQSI